MQRVLIVAGWGQLASDLEKFRRSLRGCGAVVVSCGEIGRSQNGTHEYPYAEGVAKIINEEGPFDVVAGWSMGGTVVLEAMSLGLINPSKVLLVASTARFCSARGYPFGFEGVGLREFAAGLESDFDQTVDGFVRELFYPEKPGLQDLAFRKSRMMLIGRLELKRGLEYLGGTDVRAYAERTECAMLVIHGKMDHVIPWQAGQFIARRSVRAQFELIADAGHNMFHSHPVVIRNFMEGFLAH